MPEIRCITCSNPVHENDPGVALIRMANQPRYFHKDPKGCQNAEAGNRYNPESWGLDDEDTLLRMKEERKEKTPHE